MRQIQREKAPTIKSEMNFVKDKIHSSTTHCIRTDVNMTKINIQLMSKLFKFRQKQKCYSYSQYH